MNEVRNILIGFEINREFSQIAYFDRKAKEPVSLPVKVGTNACEFPTVLSKKKGADKWFIGFEAEYFAASEGAVRTENPYTAAANGGVYEVDGVRCTGVELLAIFIRESLRVFGVPGVTRNIAGICVTTEELTAELAKAIRCALKAAGFPEELCRVQDSNESLCCFGYCQRPEVATRDIALIRFDEDLVTLDLMREKRDKRPFEVTVSRIGETVLPKESTARDTALAEILTEWMAGGSYSLVFVTGHGFRNDWATRSKRVMSSGGARVFMAENLFAKGACWAAFEKTEPRQFRSRVYLGPNLVTASLGFYVIDGPSQKWHPMIRAGVNWYENASECQIILCEKKDLHMKVLSMDQSVICDALVELPDLPKRPDRATRLLVRAEALSPTRCLITVRDLGFGEMYPSSGLVWNEEVSLKEDGPVEAGTGGETGGEDR